jgi:hypothetical protein
MFGLSNNLSETITKVIKYVLVFCVIYLLLRVIPKTPLCSRDNFIISLIITSVYVLYDMYICGKKEHLEDTSKLNAQLNSILSKINTTNPDLAASLSNLKTQVTNTVNQQVPQLTNQVQQQIQQMMPQHTNQVQQQMMPQPTMPQPTMPQPTMPQPTMPQPTNQVQQPTMPQPTNQVQQPMMPQPTMPQPTMPQVQECSSCTAPSTQDLKNNQDVKMVVNENNYNGYQYNAQRLYPSHGSRMEDGILASEMSYTDYNSIPLGQNLNTMEKDFSYTFLPPDRWYPVPPHPPVCVAEKECPVCPVIVVNNSGSASSVANLKEWNDTTRVTPGDQINTNYINDKINSGR